MDDERQHDSLDLARLNHREHIDVARPRDEVYRLVADIARTGEWSPTCVGCTWNPPHTGPETGAWFTGHNRTPDREWDTESMVESARPGSEFIWVVGGTAVRWGYLLDPIDDGARTRLTLLWEVLPGGVELFQRKFGEQAGAQMERRRVQALADMPQTLEAIRRVSEAPE